MPTAPAKETAIAPARASAVETMAGRFGIEPNKLLPILKATAIRKPKEGREATNEEVAAFVIVANQYGLNPFVKEIYAYPDTKRGGVVPIVSVDGWARIINSQPLFNGCEFEEDLDEKGQLVSTTCKMHVKGRDYPVCVTERLRECRRNTDPWNQMPHRMLRHKAFIQAARYAFSLSGIYDEDEGWDIASGRMETSIANDIRSQIQAPRRIVHEQATPGGDHLPLSPPAEEPATQPTVAENKTPPDPAPSEPTLRERIVIMVQEEYASRHEGEACAAEVAVAALDRACKPLTKKCLKFMDLPEDLLPLVEGKVKAGEVKA